MATALGIASGAWVITLVGWWLTPVIAFFLPKILACIGFDASREVEKLEVNIMPELHKTMREVDQARMLERGKVSGLLKLDKMAADLRHAWEDAEEILDEAEHKVYTRCCERLWGAAATCIVWCVWFFSTDLVNDDADPPRQDLPRFGASVDAAVATYKSSCERLLQWAGMVNYGGYCRRIYAAVESSMWIILQWPGKILNGCWHGIRSAVESICTRWIASVTSSRSARLLHWARSPQDVLPVRTTPVASVPQATPPGSASHEQAIVPLATPSGSASHEQALAPVVVPSESASQQQVPMTAPSCSSFDVFKNGYRSILYWITETYEQACIQREMSYKGVGITSNDQDALDCLFTAISRRNLKKRIEEIENTVTCVKNSELLGAARKTTPDVIASKNRTEIRKDSEHKVFGREALRDYIMAKLRKTPHVDPKSSEESPCYSVIGIYGVSGSGKTTFAQYIRDYIKEKCKQEKLFDTIMCIHVSETFSVNDIFCHMLYDITKEEQPKNSDLEVLEDKLKKSLHGKRFFLILDDLHVKTTDRELLKLISPLKVGLDGSKILVTAQTIVAVQALSDDNMIMPKLDENQFLSMFMHYALDGRSVAGGRFTEYGSKIAEKLNGSPIAASIVGGRLKANRNIEYWEQTAKLKRWDDTTDALWWSYQQLSPDIRRCFEYCNIVPRKFGFSKHNLICLWMAQGFVKPTNQTKDLEAIAEGYIWELVSFSFLQHDKNWVGDDDFFRIHDMLYELLDMVAGSDYFIVYTRRQRGESQEPVVPRDVRHLFFLNYDAELINQEIPGLENLRTLIINGVEKDTPVEEKVIESICKLLPKLRVLAVGFYGQINQPKFLVPESISLLKQLCYLCFRTSRSCEVIWPSALDKLEHIQRLEFGYAKICSIGRLSSIQKMAEFRVRDEEGYELHQLGSLDKLRGKLRIVGLENVKSQDEAVNANLSQKKGLTKLKLQWSSADCGPGLFEANQVLESLFPSVELQLEIVQAELVLESLCPPVNLKELEIHCYKGSAYPSWMEDRKKGGPKDLEHLMLSTFGQPGPPPQFVEALPRLCVLKLWQCSWDALPDNMKDLASLQTLEITRCPNIRSLPTLPQSVLSFDLQSCNVEFMESCETPGHENCRKVEHIPRKNINCRLFLMLFGPNWDD